MLSLSSTVDLGAHSTYPWRRADATLFFLSSQVSAIIYFFLSRNIRIARERAYDQTIASRGKGADWWRPYVEEWDNPPRVSGKGWGLGRLMSGPIGGIVSSCECERGVHLRMLSIDCESVVVLMIPLHAIPFAGMLIAAWFKALGTARYLHQPVGSIHRKNQPYALIHVPLAVFQSEEDDP